MHLHFYLKSNFFENEMLISFNGHLMAFVPLWVLAVITLLCFWIPVGTGEAKTLGFKLKSKKEISLKCASVCLS